MAEEHLTHNFQDYLEILLRKKWYVILCTLAAFISAWYFTPQDRGTWSATAEVRLSEPIAHSPQFKDVAGSFRNQFTVQDQFLYLKSSEVKYRVTDKLMQEAHKRLREKGPNPSWERIATQDREWIKDNILGEKHVNAVQRTESKKYVHIKTQNYLDEQLSMYVANILATEFRDMNQENIFSRINRISSFIDNQLGALRLERKQLEKDMWDHRLKLRSEDAGAGLERLSSIHQQLVQSTIDRQIKEVELEEITDRLEAQRRAVPKVTSYASEMITRFRKRLIDLEFERSLMLVTKTPKHPEVEDLNYQINDLESAMRKEINNLIENTTLEINPLETFQGLARDAISTQITIGNLKRREIVLKDVIDSTIKDLENLADSEIDLLQKQYRLSMNKQLTQSYLAKQQSVKTSMEMEKNTGTVVISAFANSARFSTEKKRWNMIAFAAFMGLLVGMFLAIFMDLQDTSIKTPIEVERFLEMPTLGEIYEMRGREHQDLTEIVVNYEAGMPLSEPFRLLRTRIEFKSIDQPLRSIMVTSTGTNEGKTTTAINLATAITQRGKRVCLVDCDMRKPILYKAFHLPRSPGLFEILSEGYNWKEAVHATEVNGLHLITSGESPTNPSELLGSPRMRQLINDLHESYSMVVFDISAVKVVTDAAVVASMVDGVLLVVAAMGVKRIFIQQSIEILKNVGANILGVSLNRMQRRVQDYFYGRGYYYYGGYYGGYSGYYYGGYGERHEEAKRKRSIWNKLLKFGR
jgi:capsular exopolysaccharide synthesis family protein